MQVGQSVQQFCSLKMQSKVIKSEYEIKQKVFFGGVVLANIYFMNRSVRL